jgi:triacylglycerol esterase/lipase EstA (alpha/beta hydrolase family)
LNFNQERSLFAESTSESAAVTHFPLAALVWPGRTGGRHKTNLCGHGVACVVVWWWEGELDHDKLYARLNQRIDRSDVETAVTTG